MPVIKIPAVISDTGSSKKVEVSAKTVKEAIEEYTETEDENLANEVLENGAVKEYVNVYVNGKDVRNIQGVDTPLEEDDEIRIIPAASGG
ncbi:MAG: MoaD/ThiS family protein [Halobacteria archaeon]|nr:MoaD/ThiS family protein [Halobacteria archaeon]